MGLGNRRYVPSDSDGGGGGFTLGMPRPSLVVKWLLIVNAGVYLMQLIADQNMALSRVLGVTVRDWWQVWRYVTFQFLHSPHSPWHIILNMLAVYILGTPLEQKFGAKKFLVFYLTCGAGAGLAYVIIGAVGSLFPLVPIIGASGGVYAIVLACAVYFPHMQLIFLFFPVAIRLASIIIFGVMIMMVFQSAASGMVDRAMSDVAHLGGAVAAAAWIWIVPRMSESIQFRRKSRREGAWDRQMEKRRAEQDKIDRILKKIHDQGIASLTEKEKKTLQEASRRQEKEEKRFERM